MKKTSKILISVLLVLTLASSLVVLTACDETPVPVIETEFALDLSNSSVWDIPGSLLALAIDKTNSNIVLRSDGTMTLRLVITSFANTVIGGMLGGGSLNLGSFVDTYLKPIVPGFDVNDIPASLELAKRSLGVSFINLDYNDTNVAALLEALKTGGTLPEDFKLPAGFGVEVNSSYVIKKVTDAAGTTYEAVYLTPSDPDTQPYLVMTLGKDENGVHDLTCMVDFVKLRLHAVEVTAEDETATQPAA